MRGEPTLWRLATEYLFIRKLAPRTRAPEPALRAAASPTTSVREVDWLYGPALLVRREAADAVGLFDEDFFMFSEEVDWLTRFRRAGWKVLFFPGAEVVHVGGASHGGQLYVENLRGQLRFFAKHKGLQEAERARRLLLVSLRLRAARAAARRVSRRGSLPLVRRRPDAARRDPMIEYLRLAFGTFVVLLPGWPSPGRCGQRSVAATFAWALAALFVAWAVVFTRAPLDPPRGGGAGGDLASSRSSSGAGESIGLGRRAARRVWIFGVVLGWFLWHVEGPVVGDGLFHEARVRKLVDLGDLHLRTVDEFKDGGLHPGYAFPLWHGFLALVAWFSGLDPEQVVRHEPSLLAPLACVLVVRGGRRGLRLARGRGSPCSRRSSRSSASGRATAARSRRSRCRRRRRASCSSRPRSRSSSSREPGVATRRSWRSSGRLR